MLPLVAGLAALAALLWAASAFSHASIRDIRALGAWIATLAGLSLAALLLLTGRGSTALAGAIFVGPLLLQWWGRHARRPDRRAGSGMTRADALEILGLVDPVTDAEIRAAWLRAMRAAHPDHGGSNWLAARVNQARDLLLGRR